MSDPIRRVRPFFEPVADDGQDWIADWRSYDIPETVVAGIRNAPSGLVAITLSRHGGRRMVRLANAAARARGARVIWWIGPSKEDAAKLEAKIAAFCGKVGCSISPPRRPADA